LSNYSLKDESFKYLKWVLSNESLPKALRLQAADIVNQLVDKHIGVKDWKKLYGEVEKLHDSIENLPPSMKAPLTPELTYGVGYKIGNLSIDMWPWFRAFEPEISWTCDEILTSYKDEEVELPDKLKKLMERVIDKKKQKGEVVYPGPRYRLHSVGIARRDIKGRMRPEILHLEFRPTNFYNFLASNFSLEEPLKVDDNGNLITVRDLYAKLENLQDPTKLAESPLSNDFHTGITIITKDNKLILTKRSSILAVEPNLWAQSVGEGMVRGMDEDEGGKPNPFLTVIRGTEEELGLEIQKEDIRFLFIGACLKYAQPDIIGIAYTNKNSEDIVNRWLAAKPRSIWESRPVPIDFEPKVLASHLLHQPWAPIGQMSIVAALIHEYGFDKVEKYFL